MPGTPTPNFNWPVPALSDPPDGATQMAALANAIDTTMKDVRDTIRLVTSTTRPAATPGAMIFETDTGRIMVGIAVASVNYWVPLPGTHVFSLRQTTAQSIPDGAYTALTFQSVAYDPFGFWVAGQPSRFTPKFPGRFEMSGGWSTASNATNYRGCLWYKNGAFIDGTMSNQTGTTGTGTANVAKTHPIPMNGTTDYLELYVIQSSGVALNTVTATNQFQPTLNAIYLGP